MPIYAAIFMFFTLCNVGLPGTSGFVGEFLSLVGTFAVNTWVALFAATGVILSAAYMLWLYRRVIFGQLTKPNLQSILDVNIREIAILTPLVVGALFFGVSPTPASTSPKLRSRTLSTAIRRPWPSIAPRRLQPSLLLLTSPLMGESLPRTCCGVAALAPPMVRVRVGLRAVR